MVFFKKECVAKQIIQPDDEGMWTSWKFAE